MNKLTDEQRSMLRYFWEEKGDLSAYCDFEELKPAIRKECPELLWAWQDYLKSVKNLDAICRSL